MKKKNKLTRVQKRAIKVYERVISKYDANFYLNGRHLWPRYMPVIYKNQLITYGSIDCICFILLNDYSTSYFCLNKGKKYKNYGSYLVHRHRHYHNDFFGAKNTPKFDCFDLNNYILKINKNLDAWWKYAMES